MGKGGVKGAGEAFGNFIEDTSRDLLEAKTLGTLEFDDNFNIGPGDNTRESLRLTDELFDPITGNATNRRLQQRADDKFTADTAAKKQAILDQQDFERRLDIAASNRAQSVRTGPKSTNSSRRSTSSRGTVSSKVGEDFLGL